MKRALVGGAVAAGITASLSVAVGQVSAWEAEALLQATQPTTRFLCSAIMTVSATILALMLTVIGISRNTEHPIQRSFYQRLQQVALLDVITFVCASILLLSLIMPFGEDTEIPQAWYVAIYYTVTVSSALIGGLLISVVLMLYGAVHDIVMLFWSDDSPALDREKMEAQQEEEARQQADRAEEEAEQAEAEADRAEQEADRAEQA